MATKKNKKLRFVWSSNGHFTNSGYAVFTKNLLFRLRDKTDFQFAEIAFFGLQGYKTKIDDILVYPNMNDIYGGDAIVNHSKDFKADFVFTMQDIWTLNPQYIQQLISNKKKWIPYLPIDQEPVPEQIIRNLKLADRIITFSKFGQKALEKRGFASQLIVEGTDTEIFKPMNKIEMRKKFKIPQDIFLFGMISANKENPPRKGYQEILEAFKKFSIAHPKSGIYFHTQQIAPSGFPIQQYAIHLGIQNHVYFLDQYSAAFKSDSKEIAKEINMFDVTINASQTEGFGLVIIESQACGVPVIVNNCHSMPELVVEGKTGEISDTNYAWWRSQNGFVYTADVDSLHSKMEKLYTKLNTKNTVSVDCRNHILQNYSIDDIVEKQWIPLFRQLEAELNEE